jgi:nitrite reductase/ring-hydroxylating ferredoxin subunit
MRVDSVLFHIDDVVEGSALGFSPEASEQDTLFAVRKGQKLYLYRDSCPHTQSPMAWRKNEYMNRRRDRIVCFAHGAQFEIETGDCLLGPCLGQSLQPVAHFVDDLGNVRLI